MLTYLIQEAKADIDCVTIDGQTPIDFIQSSEGTRFLLTLGARPTNTLDEQYFPSLLRQDPANMSVKMFVLGNFWNREKHSIKIAPIRKERSLSFHGSILEDHGCR